MMVRIQNIAIVLGGLFFLSSCGNDPNSPGIEYMPDMYRSPAIEAYVDYGMDPYIFGDSLMVAQVNTPSARKPVQGTIPYVGSEMAFGLPYAYENTTEGYEKAGAELRSPLVTNQMNIEIGMAVYNQNCTQCHGEKGKGDGAISKNGHIMGIPDYGTKLKDLPEGKMYHTLQYGKNLMGSHASQLSQKERWQVIEYIKVLQQGGEMPEFDANGNVIAGVAAPNDGANVDGTAMEGELLMGEGEMVEGEEGKKTFIQKVVDKGKEVIENIKDKK